MEIRRLVDMSLFSKKPEAKLRKQYKDLMQKAMDAQRSGDIVKSSELHAEADKIMKQIDELCK